MLSLLNNYSHGYVVTAVVDSLKRAGVFHTLEENPWISSKDLVTKHAANEGYFYIALHLLESLGWLERSAEGEYQLSLEAEPDQVPTGIAELYRIPIETLLKKSEHQAVLNRYLEGLIHPQLRGQESHITQVNNFAWLRNGPIILPLCAALHRQDHAEILSEIFSENSQIDEALHSNLIRFFIQQAWATRTLDNPREICWTQFGIQIIDSADVMGIPASYRPMLANMDALLFGDAHSVFSRNAEGQELHVDRALNVRVSGFQHERYFVDAETQILALFNHKDFSSQPRYIADMGCGDGSFLKQIYETIQTRSQRGQVLDAYPLTLIGADYNQEALIETQRMLENLPHILLKADINDPTQMQADLQAQGVQPEQILHVRSFLDHNFNVSPSRSKSKDDPFFPLTPGGVYVDAQGNPVAPSSLTHDWRAHLQRWAGVLNGHGLIVAEAHCLDADLTRLHLQSENLYFDHLHAFSGQYLIDAEIFLILAANVGLFAATQPVRTPKTLAFCRVTLSHFHKRAYQVRHACLADLPALIELERRSFAENLRASDDHLKDRLTHYPQGQFVLELDGKVVGATYSQRIDRKEALQNANSETLLSFHQPKGRLVQIIGLNILPEHQEKHLGDELLEFMLQRCSVMNGIEGVVGITMCKNFSGQSNDDFAAYILRRDDLGRVMDPILRFHEMHGARITGVKPNYRLRDDKNCQNGVWVEYDLVRRQRTALGAGPEDTKPDDANTDVQVNVPAEAGPSTSLKGIERFLESLICACLRDAQHSENIQESRYDKERPVMEIGLDSADLLELSQHLEKRYGAKIEPTFFFVHNTPARMATALQERVALAAAMAGRA